MAKPLIKITNIKRDFVIGNEIVYVLKGIDLQINKGEYVALMGPSGSGKSTLMNLSGCLDTPTSGTYILNGKDVSQMKDDELAEIRNKEIGFVFQTFNLLPRTTALDNVALPMIYAGFSKSERNKRATEVLEQVNLSDRMDHQPNQLSGGQRQRVAIARSLANDPVIVLADEPTANLDTKTGEEIINMLEKLKKDMGVTVISATHDHKMLAASDRVIYLVDGRIVRVATKDELNIKVGSIG